MTLNGYVKNGVIVIDDSTALPDGLRVRVEVDLPDESLHSRPGGDWHERLRTFAENAKSTGRPLNDRQEDVYDG